MKFNIIFTLILAVFSQVGVAEDEIKTLYRVNSNLSPHFEDEVDADNLFPSVKLETSMGDILIELDRRRSPVTVNNFLRYVVGKHYDNTLFHRVIESFVVQGGGYSPELDEVKSLGEVINESGNGLENVKYTIAMARHSNPHSATSQFYFNVGVNQSLDPNRKNWGYTVFGSVIEGQDVVDALSKLETQYHEEWDMKDVPVVNAILKRARMIPASSF